MMNRETLKKLTEKIDEKISETKIKSIFDDFMNNDPLMSLWEIRHFVSLENEYEGNLFFRNHSSRFEFREKYEDFNEDNFFRYMFSSFQLFFEKRKKEALRLLNEEHLIRIENDLIVYTDDAPWDDEIRKFCDKLNVKPKVIALSYDDNREENYDFRGSDVKFINISDLNNSLIITDQSPGLIFQEESKFDYRFDIDECAREIVLVTYERYRFCIPSWKSVIRVHTR